MGEEEIYMELSENGHDFSRKFKCVTQAHYNGEAL